MSLIGAAVLRAYRWLFGHLHNTWLALGLLTVVALAFGSLALALFGSLAALVIEGRADALDSRLMVLVASFRSSGLTGVMRAFSFVGSGTFAIPFALLVALYLRRRGRPQAATLYLGATLSGWALNGLAKFLIHRARPQVIPRLAHAGWYSFPSGHAMMAPLVFGLAALLLMRELPRAPARWVLFGCAAILVGGIALSRVYLGVHYPSDIVGALLAGVGWGALWGAAGRVRLRPEAAG
jgi:undecaprenyl-diphosphatase